MKSMERDVEDSSWYLSVNFDKYRSLIKQAMEIVEILSLIILCWNPYYGK
jgi:hypothetical protein